MTTSRSSTFSFRALGALFGASTLFFVALFVYELAAKDEIRTGVATYALLTGIATAGLLMRRSWGRSLALLLSLATAGLGVLTLLNVLFARDGNVVVPAIVFVASGVVAFWLSRPMFDGTVTSDE